MADLLEVSIGTYLMWEVGNTPWAVIPQEYKGRIADICRKFSPISDEKTTPIEGYRKGDTTAYLEEIRNFVERSYSEPDTQQIEESNEDSTRAADRNRDAIEFYCRCTAPVYLADKGRCQVCGRVGDGSQ